MIDRAFANNLLCSTVLLALLSGCGASTAEPRAFSPSYDCSAVEAGSIEALICADRALASLDRKLGEVYRAAQQKAVNEHPPTLKAEQRGWIKGRNACWKSDDQRKCVADSYRQRIAGLQARYRLVPGTGPVFYACGGNPANEIVVTFFKTEPRTLIAERGDSTSLMYLQPSASGTRYRGRNESFWEHQGEARVTWGYGAPELRCRKKSQ
ncbi:MliC family protein [Microbulbifer sp. SAOS-129_SWC]|uniref:MliC family protein n=1 Tax=Microbulbifer sp. SAOS-129_SWC TaxID=3145235 RepID=UPI00321633E6